MTQQTPTTDPTPESARALLARHDLPEDVIDGALCFHAQELASAQRAYVASHGLVYPGVIREVVNSIDPAHSEQPAVPVPPTTHAADSPSRRAGLRDEIAAALYERERPPRDPAWADAYPADREVFEAMADAVMPVLYREWPWLRAEAEDVAVPPPADRAAVLRDALRRADEADARAAAMERAMESTAADASAHRFCHMRLMAQCQRAEQAEAELRRLAAEAPQPEAVAAPSGWSSWRELLLHAIDQTWLLSQGVDSAEDLLAAVRREQAAETQQQPDTETPTESVIYEIVGDWGVDSADSAEGARAAVAKWLRAYPKCGAYAQQRVVREWPDGSEFYGPWTALPDGPAAGARQDGAQTPPTGYSDGKGRVFCLKCAPTVSADVPLTANDVQSWELCPSCGRHVVDVAREAAVSGPRAADDKQDGAQQSTLRERHRAAWNTLTPAEQNARVAALDNIDEEA